jgi:hypothetical protein
MFEPAEYGENAFDIESPFPVAFRRETLAGQGEFSAARRDGGKSDGFSADRT